MLKGVDPLLSPELVYVLASMGHGDELAIVDANFPAHRSAKSTVHGRPVTMAGASSPAALRAVLTLLPLDDLVATPVRAMDASQAEVPPVQRELQAVVDDAAGRAWALGMVERFAFYELASRCFAVVATGEVRHWGNVLVAKGVVHPSPGGASP